MKRVMQRFFEYINPAYDRLAQYIAGVAAAFVGYFLPVYDMAKFVVVLFIIDFLVGLWNSKKNSKKKFSGKLFWESVMVRMFLSVMLIMMLYQWDETYSQEFVSTYKIVAWFISGALIWSIAENAYRITKWGVFMQIGNLLKKKIEGETGVDIDKNDLLDEMKKEDDENK